MAQRRDRRGRFAPGSHAAPTAADHSAPVTPAGSTPASDYTAVHTAFRATRAATSYRVATRYGTVDVAADEITDDIRMAYTCGQCFALADALARARPGAQVGLLISAPPGRAWEWGTPVKELPGAPSDREVMSEVRHAVCVTEDGTVLDISGEQSMADLRGQAEDTMLRPTLLLASPTTCVTWSIPDAAYMSRTITRQRMSRTCSARR